MSLNEDVPLLVSSKEDGKNDKKKSARILSTDLFPWIKCRVVVTVMAFLGFCNVYALRVNLSMAIVVMVNDSDSSDNTIPVDANTTSTKSKVPI